jgi:aminomethyltransferase
MSGQEWEAARASRFRPDGIVGTPFHERTARSSQTPWYFNWDLRHVVDVYDDFYGELKAIRETVAMGDMSPLCKAEISGPDAARFVDWVIPRDTSDLKVGSIYYTPWCNHDGKVISDGLVFRDSEDSYRFTGDPTVEWFRQIAGGYDIEIKDVTDDFGILAIQGPRSQEVLDLATGQDWSDLDFSRLRPATVGGVAVEIARQGFTGELGYELLTPVDLGAAVWDAIAEAGESYGIRPCGEWAIDVARVEAGLMIPGPDYANAGPDPTGSHTVSASNPQFHSSPFELGMGWLVDLTKDEFVGKEALVAEQETGGPRRTLVGLDIDWHQIVAANVDQGVPPNVSPRVEWVAKPLTVEGRPVGRATSITWAPTVGKLIGFGHVEKGSGEPGTRVTITWDVAGTGTTIEALATVSKLPFLDLRRV